MTLGEFRKATKHLSGSAPLFIAKLTDPSDAWYDVDRVLIGATVDAIDVTLIFDEN